VFAAALLGEEDEVLRTGDNAAGGAGCGAKKGDGTGDDLVAGGDATMAGVLFLDISFEVTLPPSLSESTEALCPGASVLLHVEVSVAGAFLQLHMCFW